MLDHLSDASVTLQELKSLVLSQFANYPLQKLLNEAVSYGDESVKESLSRVLERLEGAID